MTELAYYLSFVLTFCFAAALLLVIRRRVTSSRTTEMTGKIIFSLAAPSFGLVSGLLLFPAMAGFLHNPPSFGHGEILIAAPLFNFLLAVFLAVVGCVVLGWRPIKW